MGQRRRGAASAPGPLPRPPPAESLIERLLTLLASAALVDVRSHRRMRRCRTRAPRRTRRRSAARGTGTTGGTRGATTSTTRRCVRGPFCVSSAALSPFSPVFGVNPRALKSSSFSSARHRTTRWRTRPTRRRSPCSSAATASRSG